MTYLTWLFVLPGVSLFLLLSLAPALLKLYTNRISELNVSKRRALLNELRIPETKQDDFTLIGFFHPYWYVFLREFTDSGTIYCDDS